MKSRKLTQDVVILAGGSGKRLWPLSRGGRQKQFLPLPKGETLISQAFKRARALSPASRVWVVTNHSQMAQTRRELPDLPAENILAEPFARNTAPALIWAALAVEARYGHPQPILVLPADHFVPEVEKFSRQVQRGLKEAATGESLITFGLKIGHPSSDYGYIQAETSSAHCRKVRRFVEKPPVSKARLYAKSKNYFWNSGIFAWRTDLFLEEVRRFAPGLMKAFSPLAKTKPSKTVLQKAYRRCNAESIDYLLMEKSKKVKVCPASFSWSDLGTWPAVFDALKGGQRGKKNVVPDNAKVFQGKDNLIFGSKKPVILYGLDQLVLVETDRAILLTDFEHARSLRDLHSQLPVKLK